MYHQIFIGQKPIPVSVDEIHILIGYPPAIKHRNGKSPNIPEINRSFYWKINYTCWNFRRTMLHCQMVNHNFTQ